MKRASKTIIQAVAGITLAGGGLYIFFRQGDGEEGIFSALVRDISNTSVTAIIACVSLSLLATYLRAVRWRIMLPDADARRHKRGLFSIIAVSQMLNNILPARLGEAGRVILLWKRNRFPIAASVGSLLLERTLDSMTYLLMLFVPVFLTPDIASNLRGIHPVAMTIVWVGAAAFVGLAFMLMLYVLKPQWFKAVVLRFIAVLPKKFDARARKAGVEIRSSLDWTKSFGKAASVAALTVMIALCFSTTLMVLLPGSLGFIESLFAQAFAACGSAIPLAPGFVGTLHAVLLQGLDIIGVPLDKARAAVVLYHAIGYIAQTALGLALFAVLNMRFRDVTKSIGGKK